MPARTSSRAPVAALVPDEERLPLPAPVPVISMPVPAMEPELADPVEAVAERDVRESDIRELVPRALDVLDPELVHQAETKPVFPKASATVKEGTLTVGVGLPLAVHAVYKTRALANKRSLKEEVLLALVRDANS